MKGNSIYIASDFHLGLDYNLLSDEREIIIVKWLDSIIHDCEELILLGDIFDYWFEYKNVIPKGFSRFIGKLAHMSDQGIKISIFTGNHDMWMFDYFTSEINATIYKSAEILEFHNKKFYLAHGDGLGPGDLKYKFLKKIFSNSLCQWLFKIIHPSIGLWLMKYFSKIGKLNEKVLTHIEFPESEWLVIHSKKILTETPDIDYFIYGHRHFPFEYQLKSSSKYINLGDWISHFTYLKINLNDVKLLKFNPE